MSPPEKFKENTTVVVFGASGDLAKKKTYPALFGLYRYGLLPQNTKIIGYARTEMTEEECRERVSSHFKVFNDEDKENVKKFLKNCFYVSGQYDSSEGYQKLNSRILELEKEANVTKPQRLYYLALPPSVFSQVAAELKAHVYPENGTVRLIVEKPFGRDLETSRELQAELAPLFTEDEIYRIDHYLGKEMVKNLLLLRFGNQFMNAAWNKNHIANIQISFKEPFGTEGRGGYFDNIGIIRDVIQNHLLQVMTLITMERPVSFEPEDIRDEKVKVLKCIDEITMNDVILGQYDKSEDGTKPAYTDDKTVDPKSRQCTYAAIAIKIHNERWEGVPIVLRAGKALDQGRVEVRIQYKDVARGIFSSIARNELVIRVQPNEAIYMKMNTKLPGLSSKSVITELDLTYKRRYSDLKIPEAYESLLLDALSGDHSNFVRDDELDTSWKIFSSLLHKIESDESIVPEKYPYGSRGPKSLEEFLKKNNYVREQPGSYQWPVTSGKEK